MQKKSNINPAKAWKKFYKKNNYYHKNIQRIILQIIPPDSSVVEFGARSGELLRILPNKTKVGVEFDKQYVDLAKSRRYGIEILEENIFWKKYGRKKFDYILLNNNISETENIQDFIHKLNRVTTSQSRIVVLFFNYLWKPILDITENLRLRMPYFNEPNWLTENDVEVFFKLENFEKVKSERKILLPIFIPYISDFANRYLSVTPPFSSLSLINILVFRKPEPENKYSISIVIPARNEEDNVKGLLAKIPVIGKVQEIIFVEGGSTDHTYAVIKKEIENYRGNFKLSLYKQNGIGKGDAVRMGFSKAKCEVLIILDADLTVIPKELTKFYNALSEGKGELIIGSRLIYPMEDQAMRNLNVLGNKIFSITFSFLLNQTIKDTLCGTKILLKSDYQKIKKLRKYFGDFDPFGDFDLIFGASKLNLKILEIPVRYRKRTYGDSNINNLAHGFLLFKMVFFAMKKLKFT